MIESINFISQQNIPRRSFLKKFTLLTRISFIFLAVVVALGLGAKVITAFLNSQIQNTIKETQALNSQRSLPTEDAILQLPARIRIFQDSIKNHFYPTTIFKFFRENTLKGVSVGSVSFYKENGFLNFSGRAGDFNTVASQLVFLRSKTYVSNVKVSGIRASESGKVEFKISLTLADSYVKTP